jgi:hypothetical protein
MKLVKIQKTEKGHHLEELKCFLYVASKLNFSQSGSEID